LKKRKRGAKRITKKKRKIARTIGFQAVSQKKGWQKRRKVNHAITNEKKKSPKRFDGVQVTVGGEKGP